MIGREHKGRWRNAGGGMRERFRCGPEERIGTIEVEESNKEK